MARIFLLIDISPGPFLTSTFELIIIKQVYSGGGRKWLEVSCKAALPTTFLEIRKYPHKIKMGFLLIRLRKLQNLTVNILKLTITFCFIKNPNYFFHNKYIEFTPKKCINNTLLGEICPHLTGADKPLTINSRKLAFSTAPFEAADLPHSVFVASHSTFRVQAHKIIEKRKQVYFVNS